jgi:hypothetical protein
MLNFFKKRKQKKAKITPGFEWTLNIRRCENGYVLRGTFGDNELPSLIVIKDAGYEDFIASEFKDDGIDEKWEDAESMRLLLQEVADYFGYHPSKHDMYRLRFVIEKKKDD